MRRRRPIRWFGVMVLALVAVVALPAAGRAAGHDPVLLIHGWRANASAWDAMVGRFAARDGRTVVALTLPGDDNVVNGTYIRDQVAALGWTRLDIVGVSMGGLSARYYLKTLGGTAAVDAYVSLGAPQYGIWTACVLPPSWGGQMCPLSSFIKALNTGDDTPGTVRYMTLWGSKDTTVPQSATMLDGGACHVTVPNVVHTAYEEDQNVFKAVVQAVDRGRTWCPGTVT